MLPPQFTTVSQQLPRRVLIFTNRATAKGTKTHLGELVHLTLLRLLAYPCAITGTPVAVYRRTNLPLWMRSSRDVLGTRNVTVSHHRRFSGTFPCSYFFPVTAFIYISSYMISHYVDFVNLFFKKKMLFSITKSIFSYVFKYSFRLPRSRRSLCRVCLPHAYSARNCGEARYRPEAQTDRTHPLFQKRATRC